MKSNRPATSPLRTPVAAGLAVLAATLLAGCVTNPIAQGGPAAASPMQTAWVAPARQGQAMETDGVYVNKRSIEVREQVLPPVFRQRLSMKLDVSMTLSQIAYAISRETGIRVSLAEEIRADAQKPLVVAGHSLDAPLRDVLDQLAALANTAWRYRDGAVEIYRMETRTFDIAGLSGKTELVSTSESLSGKAVLRTSSNLDFWGSVERDLKALITPAGRLSVSEANRSITVTDSLDGISAVQAYVRELNAKRSRQVAVAVAVYSVDAAQLDWQSVYDQMSQKVEFASRPRLVASTANSFGAVIPANANSSDANQRAFRQVLQSVGSTDLIGEASRMVLNGEMAPISHTHGQGANTKGFSMLVAPSIFGPEEINVTAALDMAGLAGASSALTEKFSVQSGQTYVLGFHDSASNKATVVTITPTIVNSVR